jgi:hypothetical protein
MQEIATVSNGAASLHGHVPGHLLHPSLMRMNGNPGDVHLTALEMDEKQHVVGRQSSQLCPSYPGCIINMSGYDFRKGQGIISAL